MNRKDFLLLTSGLAVATTSTALAQTNKPKFEQAPELVGSDDLWVNSKPIKMADLRGKVVVVTFWTFQCINCQRTLPYWTEWTKKYTGKDKDVVFVTMHTPEIEEERKIESVKAYIAKQKLPFPVLIDTDASNWRRWRNSYWPATYLIDKKGFVRGRWDGELDWKGSGEYKKVVEGIELLRSER